MDTDNSDMQENTKHQVLVESLKINKEIKGLAYQVGEHFLPILTFVETQIVALVIQIVKKKYKRTGMEKLEGIVEIGYHSRIMSMMRKTKIR